MDSRFGVYRLPGHHVDEATRMSTRRRVISETDVSYLFDGTMEGPYHASCPLH